MAHPTGPTGDGALLDEDVYLRALEVGRSAAGIAGPNPPVGCLIVRDGRIVGEGATRPVGQAHAEVVALEAAGELASGATAVVTLEPCAHHGRTPPCTDALIEADLASVHVLLRDPDPLAAGGLEQLAAAGVATVDVGALHAGLARTAAHDLRGFLARVRSGRPHVTLKLAQDVTGSMVPPSGGYLTGEHARRRVHQLRAASDAVLVGGGTVRADDPQLDVRLIAAASASHASRAPRPVVVSASGAIPFDARMLRAGAIALLGERTGPAIIAALTERGATVVTMPHTQEGELDVRAALAALLEQRVLTVLAEPGPRLAATMLDAGVVDVIELHVAGASGADEVRPALPQLQGLVAGLADVDGTSGVERSVTEDGDVVLRLDLGAGVARTSLLEGVA